MISIFLLSKVNSLHGSQCGLSQPRNALGSSISDVANEEICPSPPELAAPAIHIVMNSGSGPDTSTTSLEATSSAFLLLRVGEERLEAGADIQIAYTSRGSGGRLVCSVRAEVKVSGEEGERETTGGSSTVSSWTQAYCLGRKRTGSRVGKT
ncbi:hypothetical protein B0H14DRAFT_2588086 [Mycena olivaceomarginata]|nr:hypothetical protein B0H14DRAFT_2588086 [Mycena olivaceomarginata]